MKKFILCLMLISMPANAEAREWWSLKKSDRTITEGCEGYNKAPAETVLATVDYWQKKSNCKVIQEKGNDGRVVSVQIAGVGCIGEHSRKIIIMFFRDRAQCLNAKAKITDLALDQYR